MQLLNKYDWETKEESFLFFSKYNNQKNEEQYKSENSMPVCFRICIMVCGVFGHKIVFGFCGHKSEIKLKSHFFG